MAQNITLMGATYSAVPAVELPKQGGGTARFDDTTDANATAADLASGKTAYVNGVKLTGTASGGGGGGAITQDENGYLVLDPNGGGGGGSGLEYEEGTWTPSEDVTEVTINFSNAHTETPFYVFLTDVTGTELTVVNSLIGWFFVDFYRATGQGVPCNNASNVRYGVVGYMNRSGTGTSTSFNTNVLTTNSDNTASTSIYQSQYWVTTTGFKAYSDSAARYWRTGRTYKWMAVWKPTV